MPSSLAILIRLAFVEAARRYLPIEVANSCVRCRLQVLVSIYCVEHGEKPLDRSLQLHTQIGRSGVGNGAPCPGLLLYV